MPSILLVDDEPTISEKLASDLCAEGFMVTLERDGLQALQLCQSMLPDLVILDTRIQSLDGLEVCRRIRAASPVPMIILTTAGGELDRVVGLEVGADEYIAKSCSFRELLAHIRALLRRVELDQNTNRAIVYQIGCLRADTASRRVFKRGQELQLSAREFDLLVLLMSHAGQAVTRDELISRVWGTSWSGDPRTLEVHIRWLRLKIEDDPTTPRFIQTVRGFGYRFTDACEEA